MKQVIFKVYDISGDQVWMYSGKSFELSFSKRSPILKGLDFEVGKKFKVTIEEVKEPKTKK